MGLVNFKTDLSKFKKDSFTSDIENKSKGVGSGLNLNFASMRPIEDKFKEGVPQPNLSFGGSLDKPTPTVPTSMIGTLPKITQPPRGFHPDEDKPVAITRLSFENLGKTTQVVSSNWEVFMGIAERTTLFNKIDLETEEGKARTSLYETLGIANWFSDIHATGFTLHAENFGTMYNGPSTTFGALGLADWFSDIHATGFTDKRAYGDPRFPEGSEYIGIGSYDNPGILWRDSSPLGQLHPYWHHGQSPSDYNPPSSAYKEASVDWTRKPFPIFSAPPGVSPESPNPQYDTRDKLYDATISYTNRGLTFYEYFKKTESELALGERGTFGTAWDHGKMQLMTIPAAVRDIDQYTKHPRPFIFADGSNFTSFPNFEGEKTPIPSTEPYRGQYPAYAPQIPRGGIQVSVKRTVLDIERHAKWLTTTKGKIWLATQFGLKILNTRPETRIWNPLSLGSIAPTVHIGGHFQKVSVFGINTQRFGSETGKIGGPTYTEAMDYDGDNSRLSQFLNAYVNVPIPTDAAEDQPALPSWSVNTVKREKRRAKKLGLDVPTSQDFTEIAFGIKRQSIGQSIYLIPGKGGIFGAIPGPDVRSQFHTVSKEPIHASSKLEPPADIKKYKVLAYGHLNADPRSSLKRGHTAQFNLKTVPEEEYAKHREDRYKLGQQGATPAKPNKEHRNDGLNWNKPGKANKLAAVDLINLHGYVPSGKYDTLKESLHLNSLDLAGPNPKWPDLIPFYFYDVENASWILFRAYLGTITDDISSNWGSTEIAGRPVKNYYYQNTERKLSFDFKVAASTVWELAPMWQKLNYLVGLCYPTFKNEAFPIMINPFIKLTLGDMYKHVPGFLTSLNIKPEDNTPWETLYDADRGLARVPRVVNVSANFQYVGDSMPSTLSHDHYNIADWVDASNSFWGDPSKGQAIPVDILVGPKVDAFSNRLRDIDSRKLPKYHAAIPVDEPAENDEK